MTDMVQELGQEHNEALLELTDLHRNQTRPNLPLPGITTFEVHRTPDFFAYSRFFPGRATTLGILDGKTVIATASVVEREVMWETRPICACQVVDLMVHPVWRKSRATLRLLEGVRDYCGLQKPTYGYTSHKTVLSLRRGRAGLRRYEKTDQIYGFIFPVVLPIASPPGYEITEITPSRDEEWRKCFFAWRHTRNLAPSVPNSRLEGERRFLVTRQGKPVAIASLVDQSSIQRRVAVQLCLRDQVLRWGLNGLALLTGGPLIPGKGRVFRRGFVGNLFYDDRHPGAVAAVLARCRRELRKDGVPFLSMGLSEREAAFGVLANRWDLSRFFTVTSTVVSVCFPSNSQNRPTFVNLYEG